MVNEKPINRSHALWPEALAQARRACAGTLARLRRGDGGFYEADDLIQDLYCAWDALCRTHGNDETALWRAWSGLLYAGGRQVLRQPPQRLWARAERLLSDGALRSLADDTWAPSRQMAWRWRAVSEALWRLPIPHRQVIYWRALSGMTSRKVAQELGTDAASVDTRLSRARDALRNLLADEETTP